MKSYREVEEADHSVDKETKRSRLSPQPDSAGARRSLEDPGEPREK